MGSHLRSRRYEKRRAETHLSSLSTLAVPCLPRTTGQRVKRTSGQSGRRHWPDVGPAEAHSERGISGLPVAGRR